MFQSIIILCFKITFSEFSKKNIYKSTNITGSFNCKMLKHFSILNSIVSNICVSKYLRIFRVIQITVSYN